MCIQNLVKFCQFLLKILSRTETDDGIRTDRPNPVSPHFQSGAIRGSGAIKTHFYIIKLGLTGVLFSCLCSKKIMGTQMGWF